MKRLYLSDAEKLAMRERQHHLCLECGNTLVEGNIEFDHTIAGWLVEHKDKPDRAICADPCHKRKTAADAGVRAKVKRILKKGPRLHATLKSGRKMQSRPFDKRWRKRMDGSVVPRAA